MIDFFVIVCLIVVLVLIYHLTKPSKEGCVGCKGSCSGCHSNLYEQYRKDHPL